LAGLETGADDYITKPFNTRMLLARIKNLIDLRRIMQQNIQRRLTLQPVKVSQAKIDEDFIGELQEAIDKNLSDPDFNVDALCGRLYLSRATLYRKVHALTSESPTDFIRSVRLKRGAELLKQDFGTVTDVAFEVGFSSAAYFTKCFKEKFQQLPSSFLSSKAGALNGEHNKEI
jgi:AraC-like DNA-binding protein